MSKFVTLHGFGGGESTDLNFEVVGGTTQPTNPTENTIWVNTEVPITGYYFGATEPEDMADGEVYFLTGIESSSQFNALKENAIQIYPMDCKQYTGGTIVKKTAMTYINGTWIDWRTWYFQQGKGSQVGSWASYTQNNSGANKFSINNDAISFYCSSGSYSCTTAFSPKITFNNIKTLHFSIVSPGHSIDCGISTGTWVPDASSTWVSKATANFLGTEQDIAVNISSNGNYYIAFYTHSNQVGTTAYIYNIWGES